MDLGIKINGEFLDLQPNTTLELEEENPFLQLGDTVQGQYSLPLTVPITEKNMRLLGNPNLLNIRKNNTGIDAVCITNGIQHSRGQVKIESGQCNLNAAIRGSISIYYLFGISDFYKLVENKTLADCTYGSDIVFPWFPFFTFNNGGIWDHIIDVMNYGSIDKYDYTFFPVENELEPADSNDHLLLNTIHTPNSNLNLPPIIPRISKICPFIYVRFILKKIFESIGWSIESDIFNDADFKKVVIIYNAEIEWVGLQFTTNEVRFNLRDHVPRIKIGTFLISLQNRFGWWYNFDYRKKICTISYRRDIFVNRLKKEFTLKSGASYSFKLNTQDAIYSLTQSAGDQKPDLSKQTYKGVINSFIELPMASNDLLNQYYFVQGENSFYICLVNESSIPEWSKSYSNNVDYNPTDSNEEISTTSIIPDTIIRSIHAWPSGDPTDLQMVIPLVSLDDPGGETDTFYIAYAHGPSLSINTHGQADKPYPLGSASCFDLKGNLKAQTALVYEFKGNDGIERGVYATWWQLFLSYMKQREEVTIPIKVNLTDLLNLKYTDTILIKNTEYFIKNPHFTLPLNGFANMELVRI